jgi:putative long chain acyl-CoA synthase
VADPQHAPRARQQFEGEVLVLGGVGDKRTLPRAVTDLEAIHPEQVELPGWYQADPGRARDLAMVLIRRGRHGEPKVSRISNGRWAFSALGVASAATLTPQDTVYCCLPLHHPAGIMVSVGGALMGGARLALAQGFDPDGFWEQVRRNGATVVFYAGEMARMLLRGAPSRGERDHPVRIFAGSGMRSDVWRRLRERFGVGVLEFYASTERNLVLANASGEKVGALGRAIPGSNELALVRFVPESGELAVEGGRLQRVAVGEPGAAIVRVPGHVRGDNVRHGAFKRGDRWLLSGDVLRCDEDGDYWFVDRRSNMVAVDGAAVATPQVEDALYRMPEVVLAVAYAEPRRDGAEARRGGPSTVLVATLSAEQPLDATRVTQAIADALPPPARPLLIRRVAIVPLTEGFRPMKARLCDSGPGEVLQTLELDAARERYHEVEPSPSTASASAN